MSFSSPCLRTNEAGQSFCCEATLRNRFPSCRRVGNCQRLQSDLADQRVEGTCSTIGWGNQSSMNVLDPDLVFYFSGASVNKPCILPFKYQGVEYHTCTFVDSENNKVRPHCTYKIKTKKSPRSPDGCQQTCNLTGISGLVLYWGGQQRGTYWRTGQVGRLWTFLSNSEIELDCYVTFWNKTELYNVHFKECTNV